MSRNKKVRWALVVYDSIIMLLTAVLIFMLLSGSENYNISNIRNSFILFYVCAMFFRAVFNVYSMFWRYGGVRAFLGLIVSDFLGFCSFYFIGRITGLLRISSIRMLAFCCLDLLAILSMRLIYRYAYKFGNRNTFNGRVLLFFLKVFGVKRDLHDAQEKKINIAIVGAGKIGVSLVENIQNNSSSPYDVKCFIDINKEKIGRYINSVKVISEDANLPLVLRDYEVQSVVFASSSMDAGKKEKLYRTLSGNGYKVLSYDDTILLENPNEKVHLKEFSVEELLFRKQIVVVDDKTQAYYKDKVILITGGGGSIGSELCRQIARFKPSKLVILDVYENCAYDIQQELKQKYGNSLELYVEICSITNIVALERVFSFYRPNIVINAAAHKHVPLMEHNCIEAIENNVFGCWNVIQMCEKYEAQRFMMVSTDKAVNPTNVMGATKRMCEMLAQCASTWGKVVYSSTRFGNVLGSAGSVIPLFKRQIANGGPVTITDKRIVRYFMTIPEATQLVLASGAMAKNGELFVLDMGQPVKILDLAQSMIHIMGAKGIEIVETGLRPGEKLYEELLVNTEELDKTDNSLIFIERDQALTIQQIEEKLEILKSACEAGDDDAAREALRLE
ncbi:MAG: polysaccharide biosynthesis protein, partial [Sphaerochaetaceae bacterium]|nr:polysaccharide biosynthesis protein [Sphaerochaetaceae bacterium]